MGDTKVMSLSTRAGLQAGQDDYLGPLSAIPAPVEALEKALEKVWSGNLDCAGIQFFKFALKMSEPRVIRPIELAAEPLRIYLLGEPRLEVGKRPIALPQREMLLRLFVRLVLASGQPQSRKNLAFSLWPDESEAKALANLRRHLYLLRNALPPAVQRFLLIASQTVSWGDAHDYWLDVRTFEGDSEDIDELEQIVSLYRGDLAASIYTDEYILTRREELRSRYLALLKKLTQACLERNELERALQWSRKLTAQDRWDEEAMRLQMTLEALAGNRAAALATYQTLVRELESEMHTQPMPETMALYSDIINNRLPRPVRQQKPPPESYFVSRGRELTQLQSLLVGLRNRQGKIVFISGEAGVGKSFLLQEALRRFMESRRDDAPRLFWGHCPPPVGEASIRPYTPWRQIIAAAAPLLARSTEIPPQWLNRLLPLVPDLSLLHPGLLAPSQPDAAELRAALGQAITFLALDRPLVLALEDVHWSDAASLELLADLSETCQALPLLLLVTHRLAEAPTALLDLKRDLRRRRCAQEIPLSAFDKQETHLFLEKMLGSKAITAALLDEIQRYAGGMPLLLHEAAESLGQAQSLTRRSPASLHEAIRMRLTQLDNQARQMLEAVAVLGFSFSHQEMETMLDWQPAACAAVLDGLQARGLILNAVSSGLDDYTFSHQLIHQIILGEIPHQRAVILHEQAAHTLETVHAGRPGFAAEIAVHYEAAQQAFPAARFWLMHAQELTEVAAFEQAEEAIERAVALLGEERASHKSRELQAQAALQRGVIAHYRGEATQALARLESALNICREFPSLYAHALARQAYALYTCDRYPQAHQAASQSLEMARTLQDKPAIVRALNIRAITALMMGRPPEAVQDLQEALSLEKAATPSAQLVQSLNHLGTALVFVQEYTRAQEMLTQAVEFSRRGGLRRIESAALSMLGQIALNQGRYDEAIRLNSQAIGVVGAAYLPGLWGKFAGRGAALMRRGSLDEARKDFQQGLEIAHQVNSVYGQLLMRAYSSLVALAQGRAPDDRLSQLEAEATGLDLHAVVVLTALARAGLWRLLGEWEQALAACQCAAQAAQASGVLQFIQNARLEELITQALGGGIADPSELDRLSQAAQASDEVPQQAQAKLALAALLKQKGQFAEALAACQCALTLARACPDQPVVGESLLLLMRLHMERGEHPQAEACRAEIRSLARSAFAPLELGLGDTDCTALRDTVIKSL